MATQDINLDYLVAQSQALDAVKYDAVCEVPQLKMDSEARMRLSELKSMVGGERYQTVGFPSAAVPSELAIRQMCTKLGPVVYGSGSKKGLPYDYLTTVPPQLRAKNFNDLMAMATGRKWKLRMHEEGLRAILDSKFPGGPDEQGDFEITQDLKILRDIIRADGAKEPTFVRPNIGTNEMNVRALWKEDISPLRGKGGNYGIGIFVQENEVGKGRGKILPYVQRHSCENSTIWQPENSFTWDHHGIGTAENGRAALRVQIHIAITDALGLAGKLLKRMLEAEEEKLDSFTDVLQGLSLQYGWTEPIKSAVLLGTENKHTVGGLVNGITYCAHTAIEDPHAQAQMEILGGSMLFQEPKAFEDAVQLARRVNAGIVSVRAAQLQPQLETFDN